MYKPERKKYSKENNKKAMPKKRPVVSVVMPVYNVQDYLGYAIDSVLAQSYQDFELIIVDDGSTDASFSICQAISELDFRVRLIRQNNKGLAGARNTGIRASMGKYVAFLDSDDIWHTNKLIEHVSLLESDPQIGVSYNGSAFIDEQGKQIGLLQMPKCLDPKARDILLRNPIGNGSSPVIRKKVFDDIVHHIDGSRQYFNESLRQSEDIECWVHIAATTAWKFAGIAKPLTLYRVNNSGLSANVEKQFDSWQSACSLMNEYAPKLLKKYGHLAKAYQYRYLARRAVRSGDISNAVQLMKKAMFAAPSILVREPIRTTVTILATACLWALPTFVYSQLESRVIQCVSSFNLKSKNVADVTAT